MSDSTLYDDDILLWSEQRAAVIRWLGQTLGIAPDDLDIENVAEEIESVGTIGTGGRSRGFSRLVLAQRLKWHGARDDASQAFGDRAVARVSRSQPGYVPPPRMR